MESLEKLETAKELALSFLRSSLRRRLGEINYELLREELISLSIEATLTEESVGMASLLERAYENIGLSSGGEFDFYEYARTKVSADYERVRPMLKDFGTCKKYVPKLTKKEYLKMKQLETEVVTQYL